MEREWYEDEDLSTRLGLQDGEQISATATTEVKQSIRGCIGGTQAR